jgi:hypothetical protein
VTPSLRQTRRRLGQPGGDPKKTTRRHGDDRFLPEIDKRTAEKFDPLRRQSPDGERDNRYLEVMRAESANGEVTLPSRTVTSRSA